MSQPMSACGKCNNTKFTNYGNPCPDCGESLPPQAAPVSHEEDEMIIDGIEDGALETVRKNLSTQNDMCQCGHQKGDHWHRVGGVEECGFTKECGCKKFEVVAANPSPVTPFTEDDYENAIGAMQGTTVEKSRDALFQTHIALQAALRREATLYHKLREIVVEGANGYLPRPMTVITQGVGPEYYFKSHMDENLEYYRALLENIAALIPEEK